MQNLTELEQNFAQTYQHQLKAKIKLQKAERTFDNSCDEMDKHDSYNLALQSYRQNWRQHQVMKLLLSRCMNDNS